MKILAEENFPARAVTLLRQRGHDVLWVRTDLPGATGHTILRRGHDEKRLVVTFDKDFGELAFRLRRGRRGSILEGRGRGERDWCWT